MTTERCSECHGLGGHVTGCSKATPFPGEERDTETPGDSIAGGVFGFLAILSLGGSIAVFPFIVTSIRGGFYGGTALLIFFLALVQGAVLIVGVALPVLVQACRRRLQISFGPCVILILAVLGLVLDVAALYFIPVTGAS